MPKALRSRSRVASAPYAKRSKADCEDTAGSADVGGSEVTADEREAWEATRCCICLESPHNGVLLICAGHEKGCKPYICDTSARHSNCLDTYKRTVNECLELEDQEREVRLPCPLCRGTVTGQKVEKAARCYWNQKERPCAKESCEFRAKYHALRMHARNEHPDAHPTEVAPNRAQSWARAERQREMQDVLSAAFSGPDGAPAQGESESRGWTVYFLFHMLDGEVGGFSVARRFVMGGGGAGASRRRHHWGTMDDDSSDEAEEDHEGEQSQSEVSPASPPTHNYYTRSREESSVEAADGAGIGSTAAQLPAGGQGGGQRQPFYRTRSVGLREVGQQLQLEETSPEGGSSGAAGRPLPWRGVSGSVTRQLQRLGRIGMHVRGSANAGQRREGADEEGNSNEGTSGAL